MLEAVRDWTMSREHLAYLGTAEGTVEAENRHGCRLLDLENVVLGEKKRS